jgi:hypothetical protein
MRDLVNRLEENLGYKATVHEDEDRLPESLEAKKETSLRIRKDDRGTFTWIDLVKVNEHQQQEEWNRLLRFADHQKDRQERVNEPQPQEEGTDECKQDMTEDQEQEQKREEKLRKRREKMREKLNETEERLWNIKDDEDFEQKSQEIIDETIKDLRSDVDTTFLKFLYKTVKEIPSSTREQERDARMKLSKDMLTTAKEEDDHIFEAVDYHATQIAAELDERRREQFRDNLMFDRFLRTEYNRAAHKEAEEEPDTEIDTPTPMKCEAVCSEDVKIYAKPQSEDYHLFKTCEK